MGCTDACHEACLAAAAYACTHPMYLLHCPGAGQSHLAGTTLHLLAPSHGEASWQTCDLT